MSEKSEPSKKTFTGRVRNVGESSRIGVGSFFKEFIQLIKEFYQLIHNKK